MDKDVCVAQIVKAEEETQRCKLYQRVGRE